MEKRYLVRLNENNLYFKSLEGVKKWLKVCGVEDVLFTEEEEVIYSLENLEEIEKALLYITNECLCERGDEYCTFYLEEICWENY